MFEDVSVRLSASSSNAALNHQKTVNYDVMICKVAVSDSTRI